MFDPVVLYVAIAFLLAIVTVQFVFSARARRAHEAEALAHARAKLDHHAASIKLADAASKAILAIIKSGVDAMKALQAKTIGDTIAEIVKLEKETGERLADMTDDRFEEVMFGRSRPGHGPVRGQGFTMHRGDTMEDFLRSMGMPDGRSTFRSRSEAKADTLRRGYSGGDLASLLDGLGIGGNPADFKPGFDEHGQPCLKRVTTKVIQWSPGDPIPADAPPEVKELLRSVNAAANGPSLDELHRAADPYAHIADSIKDDGRTFHTGDHGSADPLADPPGSGTGGQPNGHDRLHHPSIRVESADRPERG